MLFRKCQTVNAVTKNRFRNQPPRCGVPYQVESFINSVSNQRIEKKEILKERFSTAQKRFTYTIRNMHRNEPILEVFQGGTTSSDTPYYPFHFKSVNHTTISILIKEPTCL